MVAEADAETDRGGLMDALDEADAVSERALEADGVKDLRLVADAFAVLEGVPLATPLAVACADEESVEEADAVAAASALRLLETVGLADPAELAVAPPEPDGVLKLVAEADADGDAPVLAD